MRLLVTGANGFLGSELVYQAVKRGLDVRATDRGETLLRNGPEHFQADILDADSLARAMKGAIAVIHAAGLAHIFGKTRATVAPFKAVNEIGTLNVAKAAAMAGAEHFVLISSVSVYGGSERGGTENVTCLPEGPYAESKWRAERRATEIAESTGMHLTILRLATLYGEGDPGNIGRLMRVIDRRRFVWIGDGSNRKSLIYCEDAARACLAAVGQPGAGVDAYNVSAPPCTVRDLVELLASALGRRLPPWRIPASLALAATRITTRLSGGRGPFGTAQAAVRKWLANDVYDGSKFEQEFDFRPGVSLAEGLRREVSWYRHQSTR